jgi:Flp pilus assembly protein TadG
MRRHSRRSGRQLGQTLVLFALVMSLVAIPAIGLVIDGGYALAQSRASQNAADFASLAGARIIAESIGSNTSVGTDANVMAAIQGSIATNGGSRIQFGPPNGPRYVNSSGGYACADSSGIAQPCNASNAASSYVGSGHIPSTVVAADIPLEAVGVIVGSSRTWTPFFVGSLVGQWTASATATATGGYAAGSPSQWAATNGSGNVFPAGIAQAFFNNISGNGTRSPCTGAVTTNVGGGGPCDPSALTPGTLNVPGGFGWLKFGIDGNGGKCDWTNDLGMLADGGCDSSKPFLQSEIGHGGGVADPTAGDSHGCCTQVGLGGPDLIGSLPGNKVSANCDWYIANGATVIVPVWDSAGGTGTNAYYHIVGFTGFQITACNGGKDLEGVWRQPFMLGPTSPWPAGSTGGAGSGFAGAPLAVQLVH